MNKILRGYYLCLGFYSIYCAVGIGMEIGLILFVIGITLIMVSLFYEEEPKPKPHICKYCGAETTQPDNECYANNPPPQETL